MYTLFCTIVKTILGFRMIFEHKPNLKAKPECKISAHSRNELYSINITSLLWACNYRLCHKVLDLVEPTSRFKLHFLHFMLAVLSLSGGATSYAFWAEQHQVRLMLFCSQYLGLHCSTITFQI